MMDSELVEVTQADKDAAERIWQKIGPFRMGTVSALAEALAEHRLATAIRERNGHD